MTTNTNGEAQPELDDDGRRVMAPIIRMMVEMSGDGTCEVCGVSVKPREVYGHTIYNRICSTCAEAERQREIDQQVADCLEAWRAATGISRAQMADVIQHDLEPPRSWSAIRAGELPCAAYLRGPTGTGKTTLGLAWMRALAERAIRHEIGDGRSRRKYKPRMCYAREDGLAIELSDRDQRMDLMRRWIAADVVFLDDLGSAPPPPFGDDHIGHILMERHAARKITLLASNHRLTELLDSDRHPHINDRLVSRLGEMCGYGATQHILERCWRDERAESVREEMMRRGM